MQLIDESTIRDFQETVWEYYHSHGRTTLPWRAPDSSGSFDPYKIMLSEIMLQQTQVSRVIPKYIAFLEQFPTLKDLAGAELGDVLRMWSGLGYNRRAKFLHLAVQSIAREYKGKFPDNLQDLVSLPGIGVNTAGAILAYAFNKPQPFLETNVRTVLIHHFYSDQEAISDKALLELAARSIDTEHPREWHWALMDYGSFIKQSVGNANRQSKSYAKQSTFAGSNRQVRGRVIKILGSIGAHTTAQLMQEVGDERLPAVLAALVNEGLIKQVNNDTYSL